MRTYVRKILIGSFLAAAVLVAILPWLVYAYSLTLIDGRPDRPIKLLDNDEMEKIWKDSENNLTESNLGKISPYWYYKFLACASGMITCSEDDLMHNNSRMASFVALWYLRESHYKGKGALWSHISAASLSIWLQRNWSPRELASSYAEGKGRISDRSRRTWGKTFVPGPLNRTSRD